MKIKSSWFEEKGFYKSMGKEEGLNLYIQLFRFRIHQGNYNQHIFRLTLLELRQFTKVNDKRKRKLSLQQTKDMLLRLEKMGIIHIHTPIDNMNGNEMVVIEAIDVPDTKRENGEDKPVNIDDYYVSVNFEMVNYIYNTLKLGSRELALYLLLIKLSNGGESKASMKINNLKTVLGTRNDTITNMLIQFNQLGLIATYVKRRKHAAGIKFEHVVCRSVSKLDKFKMENKKAIDNYLKRHEDKIT